MSGSRDFVQIHLQQQIALLDLVALLDLRAEAVALHLDGVNADMDQHLNTGSGHDAQRVAAVGGLGDLTVRGGVNFALGRVDAAALAQDALCKHLVGDVLHRHNGTLGISSQGHGEGWGRGGGRLGRLFQKIKETHRKALLHQPGQAGVLVIILYPVLPQKARQARETCFAHIRPFTARMACQVMRAISAAGG